MEISSNREHIQALLNKLSELVRLQDIPNSYQVLEQIIHLKPQSKITLQNVCNIEIDPIFYKYTSGISSGNKAFNQEIYERLLNAGNSEEDSRYGAMGSLSLPEAVQKIKKKYK